MILLLLTLTLSQGLNNWLFTIGVLSQNDFYVHNTRDKFQGQKSHIRKDIQNLPTCGTMRNHFNIANFDTLPRAKMFFYLP